MGGAARAHLGRIWGLRNWGQEPQAGSFRKAGAGPAAWSGDLPVAVGAGGRSGVPA